MELNKKVDESLLDQLLNDFIYDFIVPHPQLKYTTPLYSYDKFYFYLKLKDNLIPSLYQVDGSYQFNTEIVLRIPFNSLVLKYNQGREVFFDYLLNQLDSSESYYSFLNRIKGYSMSLYIKLKEDHMTARKCGDTVVISLLGTLINDINESILKGLSMAQYGILKPTDEEVLAVIKQYVKNANITLELADDAKTKEELRILQTYQPTLLTDEEVVSLHKEFLTTFTGNEKAAYGGFMKYLSTNYAYRYEGGRIRSILGA